MSKVKNEILACIGIAQMNDTSRDILMHYGVGHERGGHSGRYPWGSGEDAFQRMTDWNDRVNYLRKQKTMTENEIAKAVGCQTVGELRSYYSVSRNRIRAEAVGRAERLRSEGKSISEIGRLMDKNESTIRSLLSEASKAKMNTSLTTAEFLKEKVKERGMLDVTNGVNIDLGVSSSKFGDALTILQAEGYEVYPRRVPQVTNPGKYTTIKVLCPPGTPYKDAYKDAEIHSVTDYKAETDENGNDIFKSKKFRYPESMDSSRLQIRYAEEGGIERDGLIEIRPGVKDLSLGGSRYSQVRIMVDGTHYLKGMAVYADDLPDGVDIRFNTNKALGTPTEKVLKEIKRNKDGTPAENPFGSLIKEKGGQTEYIGDDGQKHLSLINKRSDEGDWDEWGKHLPSQFLVKQNYDLIKKQLSESIDIRKQEFDEIMTLTNPTVKQKLLNDFAQSVEGDATSLQCKGFPEQRWQAILPIASASERECYAPNYPNGTVLALIRYPHAGTFEIPIVTVNNNIAEAQRMMGSKAKDAIGINAKVAERLSGADFDGDTVMAVPCNTAGMPKISNREPLEELKGFDPKHEYPEIPGMKYMKYTDKHGDVKDSTQAEMGKITNLICDMQILGAPDDEVARAVKHSMVVIDAAKHKLNYKQSELDNDIKGLRKKWLLHYDEEGNPKGGAATIITRADRDMEVLKRRGQAWIDPETGKQQWERVNPKTGEIESKYVTETYTDAKGKEKVRTTKVSEMLEKRDPFSMISHMRSPKEILYANYAKDLLDMADRARKEAVNTPNLIRNPEAAKVYEKEAKSLIDQLRAAEANSPREHMAQLAANVEVQSKKNAEDGQLSKKEIAKLSQQALAKYRVEYGAHRHKILITEREWEAIQAGAISHTNLVGILKYADSDKVREYATPRSTPPLSAAVISRIKSLASNTTANHGAGYTYAQIAADLNLSVSTIKNALSGKE